MTENVCPSLKEVKMFQIDSLSLSSFCDIDENDQDEWDLLTDEVL